MGMAGVLTSKASGGFGFGFDDLSISSRIMDKISDPVVIRSIELLSRQGELFVRTTSEQGLQGICQANSRLPNMLTLLRNQVVSFFINKDARHVERWIAEINLHRRNYKYSGMPLWNCVAHVELSILDLLGRTANLPVNELIGDVKRTSIPVYMSSTERSTTAEEEVEWVGERIMTTGSRAAKLKIGGRMSNNRDVYPGRSETLIKLARESWGDDFVLYFDANGSYDVPKAIEMGRLLEDYGVEFFEEPVPWEDFERTRQVADALDIKIAGGEQDSSLPKWEWMIEQAALDIVQPDLMYNGGMIRTLQVAEMAKKLGINCTLHSPKNNALASYMLHFASIIDRPGEYQEFRANLTSGENYCSPNLFVTEGEVQVPKGSGFGIEFDSEFLARAETTQLH